MRKKLEIREIAGVVNSNLETEELKVKERCTIQYSARIGNKKFRQKNCSYSL